MKIYNTLRRTKEDFVPLTAGQVRMYVCGVTVYDRSHVGHARSAIVFDVIRRYLEHKGFRVRFVKNYTDVDDRIIKRAADEGVDAREISERYIALDRRDMAALGVRAPDVAPKATDHVPQMIRLIEGLMTGGYAYTVEGDVYFEVRRFSPYGRLSGKNLDELLAGARVEVDERKRDPRDFALWKAAKPGEPSWESPWGPGRPGWHIECSAMSMQYLDDPTDRRAGFDIHGGGEDLIFPHHECEIAQSEAATGKPFVRYWMHNGFVNMGREKMSKSLGNILTIDELVKRHEPDALRLWMLGAHYRNPIEWSESRVEESARALGRFTRLLDDVQPWSGDAEPQALPAELRAFGQRFNAAMDDDFNTPQALGALFDLSRALYERLDRARSDEKARAELVAGVEELARLGRVLGLFNVGSRAAGPPPEVERLASEREAARQRRDFARADALREAIQQCGWTVEDTPSGPRLARRGP